jgi:two-component system, OmpR family, response regulator
VTLQAKGMTARAVFGGLQGIAVAIDWIPDVVLLDISMPDVDGFAVASALRADWRTEKIIILAYTAHDESDVSRKASNVEFDGYCQKGQAVEPLVEMLEQLFTT